MINQSNAFNVNLNQFSGPLDLLLDLAKSQKVKIEDISITKLADQFLEYISKAEKLNLDIASEYLVMASWLAYLKSKLLLPQTEEDEFKVDEVAEKLKLQLKKLELIRLLSDQMLKKKRLGRDIFMRGIKGKIKSIYSEKYSVNLYDLLKSYSTIYMQKDFQKINIPKLPVFTTEDGINRIKRFLNNLNDWKNINALYPENFMKSKDQKKTGIAGLFAGMFGILLGFPVLRLRGDYLAIVTLAFGEMIRILLLNWYELTKGPDGLTGIPRPSFFGLPFKRYPDEGVETFHTFFGLEYNPMQRIIFLYYLILILALITNAFTIKIRRLPVGRAWEALREDEIACKSLGVNPRNTKLTAFAIGAMFGGFAGSFFATRQAFISPESFTFIESAIIVAIVVLGGMGSQTGVVLASIFLIGITEIFRDLEQYRMIAFGGAMVLIMVFKPKGILANRKPTILMHGDKK